MSPWGTIGDIYWLLVTGIGAIGNLLVFSCFAFGLNDLRFGGG
jgi:hypothetical protein